MRGLELLRTALDELRGTSFVPYYPVMLGALAQGLTEAGHVAQALATIDEALAKCERDEERWWIAELLRIKAEVMLSAEARMPLRRPRPTFRTPSRGRAARRLSPGAALRHRPRPAMAIEQGRPRRRATRHWPRSTPASPRVRHAADLGAARALLRVRKASRKDSASLGMNATAPTSFSHEHDSLAQIRASKPPALRRQDGDPTPMDLAQPS